MDQCIVNHTKKEVIYRAFINWQLSDWSMAKIIKFMRWDEQDQIVTITKYGDLVKYDYYNEFMMDDPNIKYYEKLFICSLTNTVRAHPYNFDEYKRIINVPKHTHYSYSKT